MGVSRLNWPKHCWLDAPWNSMPIKNSRLRVSTREQVQQALKKYLHPDRLVLVVAGDLEKK